MKFVLSNLDKINLTKLFEQYDINISLGEMFSYILNERINIPSNNEKEYLDKIKEILQLDKEDQENNCILKNSLIFKEINKDILNNNEYYKNIVIKELKFKEYILQMDKYLPYEIFSLDDIKVDKSSFYREITSLGYFKDETSFIALNKENITWMSIIPNEINTMSTSIYNAHGKILIGGLGLGYFAYMVSLKSIVNEIVIIENDQNIIDLFNKFLLPQFKSKKIKIINSDFIDYYRKNQNMFDYCFVDLWHSQEDGILTYITIKKIENIQTDYWLESSLIQYVRRCLITLIYEQFNKIKNVNYQNYKNNSDYIINRLYLNNINKSFNSYNDINEFLSDENIISMIKNI